MANTESSSKQRVGVLMGGLSTEREVSLKSGAAALEALAQRGYDAVELRVDSQVDLLLREADVDVVFNALHGRYGEDGCVQGLLELMRIPYTGSGVLASALSMNKVKAKELFRLHNLPTPPYYILDRGHRDRIADVHGAFGFPVVVKPSGEGSSIGVSLVHDLEELEAACERAFELDDWLLVERYIVGKEVHVGIVGGRALGAIGITPAGDIFDYTAKYTPGHAHYHVPAKLSPERYRGVLTQALRAHQALGCSGATRVDMIVSDLGNEYILEVNTNPGLTKLSLLPRIAEHAGLSYADLIERILDGARLHGMGADTSRPERRVGQRGFEGGERRKRRVASI
ncbi:MAG: D-alanine--D-alanine ligase [Myxococcales bacterium]|nr:D-alanine--D-alanine ligase [Myxococcales bacterium]